MRTSPDPPHLALSPAGRTNGVPLGPVGQALVACPTSFLAPPFDRSARAKSVHRKVQLDHRGKPWPHLSRLHV